MGALNGHHEMKYDNGDQYVGDFVDGTAALRSTDLWTIACVLITLMHWTAMP
jgi:hypothetical protein